MDRELREGERAGVIGFLPILFANLMSIGGIIWLDWRISELLVIYWIEIWVLLLVYSGAALCAKLPVIGESRTLTLPGVSRQPGWKESKWAAESRVVHLHPSLPPLYPRNFRVIRMSFIWGAGFLILPVFVSGSWAALRSTVSLALLGTVLATAISHLIDVRREYFGNRKYESMSAHMVLEIPCRLIFFAIGYISLLLIAGGLALYFIWRFVPDTTGSLLPEETLTLLFVVGIVLGKIAVEWSKYRAETDPEPHGFATWFLPENPHEQ